MQLMRSLIRCCLLLLLALCLFIMSCTDEGWFLENDKARFVPVAVTLQSCNLLAIQEFGSELKQVDSAYAAAIKSGDIIMLNNGTSIEQGQLLDFENGYLAPAKETGPITSGDETRRHLNVYMWVLVKDGPQKGKRVCVSISMRRGRHPPL